MEVHSNTNQYHSQDLIHEVLIQTHLLKSFQISNIASGTGAKNVVPGHLDMVFNFRFSTESTESSLRDEFESILHELNLDYDIDWY